LKILLTGATEFSERRLLRYRSCNGVNEICCITRLAMRSENLENVTWIRQDLNNKLDISLMPVKLDAIIQLAQSKNYRSFPEQALKDGLSKVVKALKRGK
jgi:hypothetical protein